MTPQDCSSSVSLGVAFVNDVQKLGWEKALTKHSLDDTEGRRWWEWYQREVCTPWVIRECAEGIEEIPATGGSAVPVADLPLIVADVDAVEFAGHVYGLTGEGLHRFTEMTQSVRNLIVTRGGQWLPVLRGLSALQVHGNRQDGTSIEELKAQLPTCSFLCITCGTIAGVAAGVLADRGFRTRLVGGLTMEAEQWNTYDNGHALFELFCPHRQKWVLADPDMGFLFRREGDYLDAGEVWQAFREGRDPELEPLAVKCMDPFFHAPSGFNWFLRFRAKWGDEAGKLAWYRRILQAVRVHEGDSGIYVGEEPDKIRTYCGEGTEVLPFDQWRARLYEEAS